MPALGGTGLIVEAVPQSARTARFTLTVLDGHSGLGWKVVRRRSGHITASQYRRLAALADREMRRAREDAPTKGAIILCSDGPGYRTERVHDATVLALYGFCPVGPAAGHPNVIIACAIQTLVAATFPAETAEIAGDERCSRLGL